MNSIPAFPAWAMRRARNQCWVYPHFGRMSLLGSFLLALCLGLLVFPVTSSFLLLLHLGTISAHASEEPQLSQTLARGWGFDLPQDRLDALIQSGLTPALAKTLALETHTQDTAISKELWGGMVTLFASQNGIDPAKVRPGVDAGLIGIQLRLAASRFGPMAWIHGSFGRLSGAHQTDTALGWNFLFSFLLCSGAIWGSFLAKVGALRAASEGGTRLGLMMVAQSQNLQRLRILPGAVGRLLPLEDGLASLSQYLAREIAERYGLPLVCLTLFLVGICTGAWSFLGLLGVALLVIAARLGWDLMITDAKEAGRAGSLSLTGLLHGTLLPVRLTHSLGIEGNQQGRAEHWVDRLGASRRRMVWLVCTYGAVEALSILVILGAGLVVAWIGLRGSGVGFAMALGGAFCAAGIQVAAMELARLARQGETISLLAANLFEFLDERDPPMRPGTLALGPLVDKLELDDVCLRDEGTGKRLLEGITLSIPVGQRVALVSENPHTIHALFAVLARLVEPNSGEIRLDRINLRSAREDDLRRQVSMICPSDGMLPGTILSNLIAGREITEGVAIDTAKRVHLDRLIRDLPEGYQTIVDAQGAPLSPLAKHLATLARAITSNPSLILWEDPDFALSHSEAALLDDACRRWFDGKTVLMLARRVSTLKHSEKVFYFRGPSLEGLGNHSQLMETSGEYRHILGRVLVETGYQ